MASSPRFFWFLLMAWRDGRENLPRFLLYISAVTLGIGALVAAGSFRHNLEETLRRQAKPLLGADLVVEGRRPFDPASDDFFAALPYPRFKEIRLNTVAYVPKAGAGRLLEVRAVEKNFPFYGEVHTEPPHALSRLFEKPSLLVEESVMAEFGLQLGDVIHVGTAELPVVGALKAVPGEAFASMFASPRAYIALPYLPRTGLESKESLSRHQIHFKIEDQSELARAIGVVDPRAKAEGWRVITVQERQASLGRRAGNAGRFLKLAALVTLLLGGIGVASVIFVYVRDKMPVAATLKCLGAPAGQTLGIFLAQAIFLGAVGTVAGTLLGIGLQAGLPLLADQFLRIDVPFLISWRSVVIGAGVGFGFALLFSALPLMSLRFVAPLAALRRDYETGRSALKDPVFWCGGLLLAALLFGAAGEETTRLWMAAAVPGGILLSLLALLGVTRLLLTWLRSHTPLSWPYAWRQGLANLFRPHNQTYVLVPALGLGAALLFTVSFLHSSLMEQIALSTGAGQPTLALVDVQTEQRALIKHAMEETGVEVTHEAPIVSMRIESIKGRPVRELRGQQIPAWALNRDYRSTYRDNLTAGEEIVAGIWPAPSVESGAVPVSIEEGIARDLLVDLDDEIVFNVQGVPFRTTVASIRKVDWFHLRPNFFVVFPEGVLEEAPQFFVMMARAGSAERTAAVQRLSREKFPNVSVVDLRMILDTLDQYFEKLSWALKFMASFVMAAGLLILAGALVSTRYERLREAALLRTLGASTRHVRVIHLIEYGLTGLFSGLGGLAIGGAGSYILAKYVFKIGFAPGLSAILVGLSAMVLLSSLTGVFLGRGMLRHSPLQTLRTEGEA